MTQHFYADISTKVAANMGATRPGTVDVQGTLLTDLDGTLLAANFDIRIENEILRVTSISVAGGGTGIDRWSVSHIGGAAASTHQKGQEIEVVLTPEGLSQYITDLGGGGSTTLNGDTDVDFTEVALAKGDIIVYNLADAKWENLPVGSNTQVLTADSTQELGVKWAAGGGGGGGAATTDHYIVGRGGEADTDLSAKIVIPGLSGSPDVRAGGGSDDEFDQNTSGVPSGWTGFGSPDTVDTNVAKSHLHLQTASNGGSHGLKGVLIAAPAIPYTVTAKLAGLDVAGWANFGFSGLVVMDGSSSGKVLSLLAGVDGGPTHDFYEWSNWASPAFVSNQAVTTRFAPLYQRYVVHSASNIDVEYSFDGLTWHVYTTGVNFLVSADHVGLGLDPYSQQVEAFYDWIRFS